MCSVMFYEIYHERILLCMSVTELVWPFREKNIAFHLSEAFYIAEKENQKLPLS